MTCPRCQAENDAGARFCEDCGARLEVACPSCGTPVTPGKKFCRSCGAALEPSRFTSPQSYTPKHLAEKILTSKAALEGERKQVTVLFADLKGSMELLADHDPEEARKLLDPVLEHMMEAVHRYEGTVNQVMGDGIMALFGAPLAHEDHAVRACYAALRMQESVKKYAEEVRRSHAAVVKMRVGVNSGEVVVRSVGSDLRMDYTAVGETTHLAARMEQLATPGTILLTRQTAALVEDFVHLSPRGPMEVKGLRRPVDVFELTGASAVRSRLHAAAARGLTRFVGRDADLAVLRRALDAAADKRGHVIGVAGDAGVGKSRLVWQLTHSPRTRDWLVLEAAAVSYGTASNYLPVVELLQPYFQIEPRDDTPKIREKVTGKLLALDRALDSTVPALLALLDVPVEDPEWTRLAPTQRRRGTLDAIKGLLLRESQAQPLLLVIEDLQWIDSETQALLETLVDSVPTARILMLVTYRPEYAHGWGSKLQFQQLRLDVMRAGAADELLEALDESEEERVRTGLDRLQAADFLNEAQIFPELEFTFKHPLTLEVAYGGLLGDRRIALHAALVTAYEQVYTERLTEHVERLAHHATRGQRWDKAVTYAHAAGRRCIDRSTYRAAQQYLEDAVAAAAQLPEGSERLGRAIDGRLDLRAALLADGEPFRAFERLVEAEELATRLGDRNRIANVVTRRMHLLWLAGQTEPAREYRRRALEHVEAMSEPAREIATHNILASVALCWGEYSRAEAHAERVIELLGDDHARARGDGLVFPAVSAPGVLAAARAEQGQFESAIQIGEEAVRIAESLSHPHSLVQALAYLAYVHQRRGGHAEIEALCRLGLTLADRVVGVALEMPLLRALRGHALICSGSVEEGLKSIREAIQAHTAFGVRVTCPCSSCCSARGCSSRAASTKPPRRPSAEWPSRPAAARAEGRPRVTSCSGTSQPGAMIPRWSSPRLTISVPWRPPSGWACAPSSPTATWAWARSTGARAGGRRRKSISPPRRRCIARWA